jgi:AmiR/NasT family two-component response regulator
VIHLSLRYSNPYRRSVFDRRQAREEIEQLTDALATRTVIGQATGLLMRDLGLTSKAAFAQLVTLSSHSNVKLREIAERLVVKADREVK